MRQRGDHDVVPCGAGFGANDVVLDGDLGIGEQHDGQVGEVVCHHHVGSPGEHEDVVYSPQDCNDLLSARTCDQSARNGSDAQRGQRRQRHVVGDGGTPQFQTGHGR